MIHYPPQYRYGIFEDWHKEAFYLIKDIAKTKNYPKISGTNKEKNQFLITLLRTQKALHGWKSILISILDQIQSNGIIDAKTLNEQYPPSSIGKDTPAWVTYKEDKIVSEFMDELETRRIDFIGTNKEMSEFILRFILGQLGHDWEQTIFMIWELLGEANNLSLQELNKELKNFDYLKLFE